MMVRRMLSENEIKKYARVPDQRLLITRSPVGQIVRIPIAIESTSALSVASVPGGFKHVPTEPMYMRQGKETAQKFIE